MYHKLTAAEPSMVQLHDQAEHRHPITPSNSMLMHTLTHSMLLGCSQHLTSLRVSGQTYIYVLCHLKRDWKALGKNIIASHFWASETAVQLYIETERFSLNNISRINDIPKSLHEKHVSQLAANDEHCLNRIILPKQSVNCHSRCFADKPLGAFSPPNKKYETIS